MPSRIETGRIYDTSRDEGNYRVLVDRLWPRGISKENADLDAWSKELTPSSELRKWFHRDPGRWDEFCDAYRSELAGNKDAAHELLRQCGSRQLVLLYAARNTEQNHAIVLADFLAEIADGN